MGTIAINLKINDQGYSSGVDRARRSANQLKAALDGVGHNVPSQMQAASAAIRVVEGNMTNNIRAAERFISTIPGVGRALQAAFPLVGAIAFAGVAGELVKRVTEFIQTTQKMPQAIDNAFRQLNIGAQSANDSLALTNDRLQNEILKLEGKPQNNLSIAIDEARLAADKLAESLDRDNQKIAEMLKTNHLSFLGGFLGKSGTSLVEGSINSYDQQLSNLGVKRNVAVHGGDTAGAAQLGQQIDAMRQSALNWVADQIRQRTNQGPGGLNQDANLSILQGYQTTLLNQGDQESLEARNSQLTAQKEKLQAAKELAEAQKQAQELIVQQWRKSFDEAKADNDMTLAQDGQFWVQRMESARKGSISYIAALDEANKAIAQMRAENMRGGKEFDKLSAQSYLPDSMDLSKGDTGAEQQQGRSAADWLKNMRAGADLQRQNAAAWAQAALQMDVAAGRIDSLDAAQRQAKIHTDEYTDSLKRLQDALAAANNLPDSFAKKSVISGLNDQASQLSGQRQIQSAQDQQAIASQQLGSGLAQTVNVMAQQWSDMTKQIEAVMVRAADSLNDSIARAATGQKGGFGKAFQGIGESLVKASVQGIEGYALKALHLGGKGGPKPDGTQNNRIYVSALIEGMQSTPGAAGNVPLPAGIVGSQLSRIPGYNGSALADFIHPFIGGNPTAAGTSGAQAAAAAQSGGGSIFSKLLSAFVPGLHFGGGSATTATDDWGLPSGFQGGFGGGGDFMANRPMIVGEHGPELLTPGFAGHVTPNSASGGGGDTHHWHIDARGATDPEAVNAAVMRAAPSLIAASVQAVHHASKRSPSGR